MTPSSVPPYSDVACWTELSVVASSVTACWTWSLIFLTASSRADSLR
ncbi:MAG: hypothetical protein K8R48_01050 [Alphaproteobacteria bacterium]|nr:hypothetical protein [Alphaproteobacteria bacterium]